MSKHTNNWILEDLEVEKQSLIHRYLRNPLSLSWLKLTALFQTAQTYSHPKVLENYQSEHQPQQPIQESDLYLCFTNRVNPVNPSLYRTVFFPHQRF